MISIIIPVYNQAEKLDKCLESIFFQTFRDFEIVIVNDGSTDHLSQVIEKHRKALDKLEWHVIHQENQGSNPARNKGARKACGDYLLFCDADIFLDPLALEIMYDTLQKNPGASYAYSSFMWGLKLFKLGEFDEKKLKKMPYIHTTSLIRREAFLDAGFDEKIKRLQDWDLWLSMLEKGRKGVWIDQVLFRVETGGTMSAWLPSLAYKLLPFLANAQKYKKAVKIIKDKHRLA